MKNKFKILFVILSFPLVVSAQSDLSRSPSPSFDSRIFSGGNFGLQFGTFTLIELQPMVGYKVTDKFVPGVSVTYIYERVEYPGSPIFSSSIYGGSVFMRYYITPSVFAHVEYQVLNLEVPTEINNYGSSYAIYARENVPNFFIGGGYRQPIGWHSSVNILLLYDILQNPNSPFSNPLIEIGLGFGI